MSRIQIVLPTLLAVLIAAACPAAVFISEKGMWPQDWPRELEPLRDKARTLDVGTGIQEHIYEIPLADRATFERIWPVILKLRTPGGKLTLYRTQSAPPKAWGDTLSNKAAAVRIYAPSGGLSTKQEIDVKNPPDFEKLIADGLAVRAAPPWPKEIVGENGELPEYVVAVEKEDRFVWEAGDPFADKEPRGFYHRARIDIELVVDGRIIDLNHTPLPENATIVDRRFDAELE